MHDIKFTKSYLNEMKLQIKLLFCHMYANYAKIINRSYYDDRVATITLHKINISEPLCVSLQHQQQQQQQQHPQSQLYYSSHKDFMRKPGIIKI